VNAETAFSADSPRPRWRRRVSVIARRSSWVPAAEIAIAVVLVAVLAASYWVVARTGRPGAPLAPELVALLVAANIVPAMALMVMVARRLAIQRALRSAAGGRGRLHVRLVALFSIIATVPTLLVVFFASLLFQSGVQFWFSDRARTVLDTAAAVAESYVRDHVTRITSEVVTMRGDVVLNINDFGVDTTLFGESLVYQVVRRDLSEAAIFRLNARNQAQTIAMANLDARPAEERFPQRALRTLQANQPWVTTDSGDRVEALIRLDPTQNLYLYISRAISPAAIRQLREAQNALSDYRETLNRSRDQQLRFNAILLIVSLLIVAIVVWIALALADRLVRPIGELVGAARRVTAGDLSARVAVLDSRDEVGALGSTFNRMTSRLEEQRGELVSANAKLDSRRAFTEAVLSGVSAGVISVDEDHVVQLINSSAEALLKTGGRSPVGQKLVDLAPELDRQLTSEEREDVVQLASSGEPRTLALKTVKVEGGYVLTFDDITEQLLDQRRAAWSDVARRIAHEIKNPLTPIQLAAERLQRRYGAEIGSDPATFQQLTATIVRQVGDLRRMVDEFSSFARMPKPTFAVESLGEIARQSVFLHEVAHPDIAFTLDVPEPAPTLVADRRLLGQALTNILKNGIEAIQQKREEKKAGHGPDQIAISVREEGAKAIIEVSDTGIGLPAERTRMTEPYMTTRAKGTGLGLAIVKKIVEEHFGVIEFADRPGGGSVVRMIFDGQTLAQLSGGNHKATEDNTGTG
jgi:two-component system nitrogen regulation sensor histidine kinase NtrY